MARKRHIRISVPTGSIPGIGDDGLVQPRTVRSVIMEKKAMLRRGGERTATERASDTAHRNYGIPVYDRQTAQAHLAELLHRGRTK